MSENHQLQEGEVAIVFQPNGDVFLAGMNSYDAENIATDEFRLHIAHAVAIFVSLDVEKMQVLNAEIVKQMHPKVDFDEIAARHRASSETA